MAWVNYYDCKNAVDTTLTDLIGTNNGTLEGSPLPTINANGYLSFVGDNGASGGNLSRVLLTAADYQYAYTEAFTMILKAKKLTQTNVAVIYAMANNTFFGSIYFLHLDTDGNYLLNVKDVEQDKKECVVATVLNKNIVSIISYNNNTCYILYDGKLLTLDTDDTLDSNLYHADSKATIGCVWREDQTEYRFDSKADVYLAANANNAMSVGEMKTYDAYLRGFL